MILTCSGCGKTENAMPTNRLYFCADCIAPAPPTEKRIEITERPRRVVEDE